MEKAIKILVPIDFSECSENALVLAIQLAEKIKANLTLLNVIHIESGTMENYAFVSEEIENKTKEANKRIIKLVQKVTERNNPSFGESSDIQIDVQIGNVESTISEAAIRNQADYIVMGTQGENSVFDKYLGSVASNVLKNAPCPVMVIPENTQLAEKLVLGYATDFSDADPFEIWKAIHLFQPFHPQIKLVHFHGEENNASNKLEEMEQYFNDTSPELDVELYSFPIDDKVKNLNEFVEEYGVNMLVMYKPKRSFFESIFHQSYTQEMAKHSSIPLLVLKET